MEFNVLKESWIPVLTTEGESLEVGLEEFFLNAHKYSELNFTNAMEEYSLYRFLILFLTAVYKPASGYELIDIYESGQVSKEKLKAYIDVCIGEGVSFDLFDKERPFLQSPPDPKFDAKDPISVANLDYTRASGNNHVHFDHTFKKDAVMTPKQAAISLITAQVFASQGGRGYQTNIYGAPPRFWLIMGNTIFETLVLSMKYIKNETTDQRELWRYKELIDKSHKVSEVSYWLGMLFPVRRIRLIEDHGQVKKIYMSPGLKHNKLNWEDPHVEYVFDDKNSSSLKPLSLREKDIKEASWKNINTIKCAYRWTEGESKWTKPVIVNQYLNGLNIVLKRSILKINTYAVATKQAKFLQIFKGSFQVNVEISQYQQKCNMLISLVNDADKKVKDLKKSLNMIPKESNKNRDMYIHKEIDNAIFMCYEKCQNEFDLYLCPALSETDNENKLLEEIQKEWNLKIKKIIFKSFNDFCNTVCNNAELMFRAEKAKECLYKQLN